MKKIKQIEQRRQWILAQMGGIRSMELSTLSEQMLAVRHKREAEPVLRGPYYVLARRQGAKTRSRRVRGEELAQVQVDVANRKRFEGLCAEFTELTEQLGQLERQARACGEQLKKGLKSRSNKAGKSRG